jgi:tRNA G10  N-methylase Trm11
LVTHYDLDFPKEPQTKPYKCRKHDRVCQPTQNAYKFIYRYSLDTIDRIFEFSKLRTDAKVDLFQADSRKTEFPQFNGIITSPPYVGLIDYHEQHVYAYHLLNLKDIRFDEIGPASNGSSTKAINDYKESLIKVFGKANKSMVQGGRMIVVASDKYNLYDEIAQKSGLVTENVINRHVNRRTGRRTSNFFESVFIWKKL